MDSNIYNIIDTSVKIGLGAFISAFSSYVISKLNHRADTKKEFFRRYMDTIEKLTDSSETYFQKWITFVNCIAGDSRRMYDKGEKIQQEEWEQITLRDKLLVESRNEKQTATARLRLLGEYKAAKILEETNNIEQELRDLVLFEQEIPTLDKLMKINERMRVLRKSFYTELNKCYSVNNTNCS